jgi:hypothetical protein
LLPLKTWWNLVDLVTMGAWDSIAAGILRARYRCTMCHKQCLVPCKFTAAEFRQMMLEAEEGGSETKGETSGLTESK